jgi:uncharacterized protein (TIGR00369 family)
MTATRNSLIRAFLPASPFARRLGLEIEHLDADGAALRLPFDAEHATFGDTVHGGAIATLIDTAGMVAAWGDDEPTERPAGATVSMAVDYVSAARGTDLVARARVVRRGRSLCFVQVDVVDDAERVVATGLVTHRFAQAG